MLSNTLHFYVPSAQFCPRDLRRPLKQALAELKHVPICAWPPPPACAIDLSLAVEAFPQQATFQHQRMKRCNIPAQTARQLGTA